MAKELRGRDEDAAFREATEGQSRSEGRVQSILWLFHRHVPRFTQTDNPIICKNTDFTQYINLD